MNQTISKSTEVIGTLNDLIAINRDAQKGFQDAAEKIKGQAIKTLCLEQSLSRAHFVGELQTMVHSMGDEPGDAGSISGALRRGWMDLRAALGGGDHAILMVVESSEDRALAEYRRALSTKLPTDVHDIVDMQGKSIRQVHDKIKALRDSLIT